MHKVVSDNPGCKVDGDPAANIEPGPADNNQVELERFKNSFNFLNEIVVHVLDFHYFYDASARIFLGTLWRSWSNVPGVADKIEWYILRCLAAISVGNLDGMTKSEFPDLPVPANSGEKLLNLRFVHAMDELAEVVEEICAAGAPSPVLQVVLAKLKHPATVEWLRRAFFPCHLLAQVVKQFLYSRKLRDFFDSFDDPLADRTSELGTPVYLLDTLEFSTAPIRNPIAFLRDRLIRKYVFGVPVYQCWLSGRF